MADGDEDERVEYLDAAYELVDGSPQRAFDTQKIRSRLGVPDRVERDLRRTLTDKGLLRSEGDRYRLTVPAIHEVEQVRLEQGLEDEVEARSQARGDYVRAVYDLVDGAPGEAVDLSEIQEELELDAEAEKRTREYLLAADLIEATDGSDIALTPRAVDWVEGR